MKKLCTAASAFLAVLLMAIPAQSQAFFGFFGGGFSFGFGGGGWGGPGYWGPYWRRGYWGNPYYRYGRWRRPYFANRFWGMPYYGYPYFHHLPVVATVPAATPVKAPEVKAK